MFFANRQFVRIFYSAVNISSIYKVVQSWSNEQCQLFVDIVISFVHFSILLNMNRHGDGMLSKEFLGRKCVILNSNFRSDLNFKDIYQCSN